MSFYRGFQGIFTFEQETSNSSANVKAATGLLSHLSRMESTTGSQSAAGSDPSSAPSKPVNGNFPKNVKYKYNGDQLLKKPPNSLNDVMTALKDFPKFAKNSTKVTFYSLSPIKRYCESDLATIIKDIGVSISERLSDIPDEIEETKLQVKSLLEISAAAKYGRSIGMTLITYLQKLKNFEIKWKENAKDLVLKYRIGAANDFNLITAINVYAYNNPFSQASADLFLRHRQRELDTVEAMIHVEAKGIAIEEQTTGDGNACIFQNAYSIQYVLKILPSHNVTDQFIQHVNKYGKDNYSEFEENNYWFWNESLISRAGKKHRGFLTLFETMENKKESCFMIKLLKQDSHSVPAIVLYKNGQSVNFDYLEYLSWRDK